MALLQQTNQQRSLIGGSKVWKFDRLAASCSGRLCRPSGDAGDASLIAADVASKLPESIALRSNKLCLFLLLDLQKVKKIECFTVSLMKTFGLESKQIGSIFGHEWSLSGAAFRS